MTKSGGTSRGNMGVNPLKITPTRARNRDYAIYLIDNSVLIFNLPPFTPLYSPPWFSGTQTPRRMGGGTGAFIALEKSKTGPRNPVEHRLLCPQIPSSSVQVVEISADKASRHQRVTEVCPSGGVSRP
jgi:hypothetical protein